MPFKVPDTFSDSVIDGVAQPYGLNEVGFQGKAHDESVGIINYNNRVYLPTLGIFPQRDLIGYPDGMNAHAAYHVLYGGLDPSGLAAVFFDGTGNDPSQSDNGWASVTNVRKLYLASNDPNAIYKAGVGSSGRSEVGGGAFGNGGRNILDEAWEELAKAMNNSQDDTIDLFGFSRGSSLALEFSHMIVDRNEKYPNPRVVGPGRIVDNWTPICKKLNIRFMGLFDTVGSFGVPGNDINIGYRLSIPSGVGNAAHAMSLNEQRASFPVTRLSGAHEVWFSGVHSNIGGGYVTSGLSDITLIWMYYQATAAGVDLTKPAAHPSPYGYIRDPQSESSVFFTEKMLEGSVPRVVGANDQIHITVLLRASKDTQYMKWLKTQIPSTTGFNHDPWQ